MKITRRARELYPHSKFLRHQWLRRVLADRRSAKPVLLENGAAGKWGIPGPGVKA